MLNISVLAEPMVFTSKLDALAAIKKYTGARFMQFSSYDDAVEYSVKPLPSYTSQACNYLNFYFVNIIKACIIQYNAYFFSLFWKGIVTK